MSSKLKYGIFFLLIFLALFIQMAGFMKGLDWGCDYGGYIIQSKTLVSADFKNLQEHMKRNDFILNYPWGFPIALTPVIHYFETNVVIIKEYVFLFFVISLLIVYLLFKDEKDYALLTVLFLAGSPYFWYFKNYLFSDFPNLCFNLFSLLLIKRIVVERKQVVNLYFSNALIGLVIFISFTMRTQSIVLLMTLAAMQIIYFRKELLNRKVLLQALTPYLFFIILNFLLKLFIPIAPVSYLNAYNMSSLIGTVWTNIFYYTNAWKELFKDIDDLNQIDGIVTGACLVLALTGVSLRWKENLLYIVFCMCCLAPVIVAPFYQGLRYLMPLVPVLFYFFVKGSFYVTSLLYRKRGKLIAWLLTGSLAFFSLRSNVLLSYTNYKTPFNMEGPYLPTSLELFKYLRTNTSKEDLIGYWKPRAMLLYSGRNGIIPQTYNECETRNAGYYVHYRNAYADQIPLDTLVAQPKHFKLLFENKDFKVFKVLRDAMFNLPKEITEVNPSNAGDLVMTINCTYFESSLIYGPEKLIPLWSNGVITSKKFNLSKGNYILSIYSRGTKATGEFPLNKISLNEKEISTYYSTEKPGRQDFKFNVDLDMTAALNLKLENDLSNDKEDRNTLIYFINIYKTK